MPGFSHPIAVNRTRFRIGFLERVLRMDIRAVLVAVLVLAPFAGALLCAVLGAQRTLRSAVVLATDGWGGATGAGAAGFAATGAGAGAAGAGGAPTTTSRVGSGGRSN